MDYSRSVIATLFGLGGIILRTGLGYILMLPVLIILAWAMFTFWYIGIPLFLFVFFKAMRPRNYYKPTFEQERARINILRAEQGLEIR